MWILNQLDPADPAYLMTWVLRLAGPLNGEALRAAWERVVARHEVLRTRYTHEEGELRQSSIRPRASSSGGSRRPAWSVRGRSPSGSGCDRST